MQPLKNSTQHCCAGAINNNEGNLAESVYAVATEAMNSSNVISIPGNQVFSVEENTNMPAPSAPSLETMPKINFQLSDFETFPDWSAKQSQNPYNTKVLYSYEVKPYKKPNQCASYNYNSAEKYTKELIKENFKREGVSLRDIREFLKNGKYKDCDLQELAKLAVTNQAAPDVVSALIQTGISIDRILYSAFLNNVSSEIIDLLIEAEPTQENFLFLDLAKKSPLEVIEQRLGNKIPVLQGQMVAEEKLEKLDEASIRAYNLPSHPFFLPDLSNEKALVIAVCYGSSFEVLKSLVDAGARDPEQKALLSAVQKGASPRIIDLLLQNTSTTNSENMCQSTTKDSPPSKTTDLLLNANMPETKGDALFCLISDTPLFPVTDQKNDSLSEEQEALLWTVHRLLDARPNVKNGKILSKAIEKGFPLDVIRRILQGGSLLEQRTLCNAIKYYSLELKELVDILVEEMIKNELANISFLNPNVSLVGGISKLQLDLDQAIHTCIKEAKPLETNKHLREHRDTIATKFTQAVEKSHPPTTKKTYTDFFWNLFSSK